MGTTPKTVTRYRGDTYSVEVYLAVDDTPVDLSTGNNTALFSFAKGNKRVSIPGANGTVEGEVSFPFPADVFPGTYVYDIQVTASSGEIRTFVKDTLNIIDDISQ